MEKTTKCVRHPQDEALFRILHWKFGHPYEGTVQDAWVWFNSQLEYSLMNKKTGENTYETIHSDFPDHLTYRVMLESKLKEVADELFDELQELKRGV